MEAGGGRQRALADGPAAATSRERSQSGRCLSAPQAVRVAVVLAALAAAHVAVAAEYPQRAVRMLIPYPPGGAGDIVGRLLSAKLTDALGQQVIVDNRGGGGQVIATQLAASAPPDGHTVFLASATHSVNPALREKLPYDTLKDFAPITLVAQSPLVFVAHPSLGVSNMKELIAAAKARSRGSINYASSGPGTGGHMSVELLKSMTGIDLVHMPYKGAGPALVDLIAGQVQMMCTSPLAVDAPREVGQAARARDDRARSARASRPTCPQSRRRCRATSRRCGTRCSRPAGTPQPILNRLHDDTVKIVRSKDVVQQLEVAGRGAGRQQRRRSCRSSSSPRSRSGPGS